MLADQRLVASFFPPSFGGLGMFLSPRQSWRVYLSEDLQGNNPSAVSWDLPVSFNAMAGKPGRLRRGKRGGWIGGREDLFGKGVLRCAECPC